MLNDELKMRLNEATIALNEKLSQNGQLLETINEMSTQLEISQMRISQVKN